jgi:hypothetical protein
MTSNDEIRDLAIAHQVYLLRYQAQIAREITELLQAVEKDLLQQLNTVNTEWQADRLEQQLQGVRTIISESWRLAEDRLQTELNDLAVYEAEHQDTVIQDSTPIELNMVMPAAETIIAAVESRPFEGKILQEWIDKLEQDSYVRIRDAVRMGIVEGESYQQITKRVMGSKALRYSDGVMALNYRQAQALVATSVAHTVNQARQTFYGANDDLIKGVQWVSTLDARTCWSKEAKVLMADGSYKPIGNISEGEYVIGGVSGKPCKVIGTFVSVVPSSIAIHYNGSLIGRTTHDHRMLTPDGWERAEELCLSSDVCLGKVICRSVEQSQAEIDGALEQIGSRDLRAQLRAEKIWESSNEDSCGNADKIGSLRIGDQVHSGNAHTCSERVQHDERRGRSGSSPGKIYRDGKTLFEDASDKSRRDAEAVTGCKICGAESIERQQEVLCDRCRERVHSQKVAIFLERERNKSESATENASEFAKSVDFIERKMAGRRISGASEFSQRTSTSDFESDKSAMGASQSRENVRINEEKMVGTRISRTHENSSCTCSQPRIKEASTSKTETILDRGTESDCRGENKIVLGKAQETKIGQITGTLETGNVEIVSLSVEGDHSYVVGELIVHNTPICQSRDGKVYPLDSGPRPPAHFRCRSTTAPVLKSWKELGLKERDIPPGTRASMDGQVPEAETYQTWLKKKSPAFQDDVLGPTRGKLFREGMTLDRFVDETGHEYTLKQLRSKDAALFKKAGID